MFYCKLAVVNYNGGIMNYDRTKATQPFQQHTEDALKKWTLTVYIFISTYLIWVYI